MSGLPCHLFPASDNRDLSASCLLLTNTERRSNPCHYLTSHLLRGSHDRHHHRHHHRSALLKKKNIHVLKNPTHTLEKCSDLIYEYEISPCFPDSPPYPLSLTPPKYAAGFGIWCVLIHTIPASSRRAIFSARSRSFE